jgi:anti-sigma B factor antagonist
MRFATREVEGIVIFDIEGKILLDDGDVEIKQKIDELISTGKKKILLNLAKCPYIDSSGFGEIIRSYTILRKQGGCLKLLALNQRILDLLAVTKLANVFDWYSTEEEAVLSFSEEV